MKSCRGVYPRRCEEFYMSEAELTYVYGRRRGRTVRLCGEPSKASKLLRRHLSASLSVLGRIMFACDTCRF